MCQKPPLNEKLRKIISQRQLSSNVTRVKLTDEGSNFISITTISLPRYVDIELPTPNENLFSACKCSQNNNGKHLNLQRLSHRLHFTVSTCLAIMCYVHVIMETITMNLCFFIVIVNGAPSTVSLMKIRLLWRSKTFSFSLLLYLWSNW